MPVPRFSILFCFVLYQGWTNFAVKNMRHPTLLVARMVTWDKFHTEKVQTLGRHRTQFSRHGDLAPTFLHPYLISILPKKLCLKLWNGMNFFFLFWPAYNCFLKGKIPSLFVLLCQVYFLHKDTRILGCYIASSSKCSPSIGRVYFPHFRVKQMDKLAPLPFNSLMVSQPRLFINTIVRT